MKLLGKWSMVIAKKVLDGTFALFSINNYQRQKDEKRSSLVSFQSPSATEITFSPPVSLGIIRVTTNRISLLRALVTGISLLLSPKQSKEVNMAPSKLFSPLQLGSIGRLKHRVVMAPLTRLRATEPGLVPSPLAVQYYRQRASPGGLLISEATNISPESHAYPSAPGIWSDAQVEGWKKVNNAVHEKGGFITCQLWHCGRIAHPNFKNHPAVKDSPYIPGVSSSAVPFSNADGSRAKALTYDGFLEHQVPRALREDEIPRLRQDYHHAAKNAELAGFDGVEVHAAHGYLIDQFLNNQVNKRTDKYGGSIENRCRLLKEVLETVLQVWPAEKVGVRLSPHDSPNGGSTYHDCQDSDPDALYQHAIKMLDKYNLAYLLLTEPSWLKGKTEDPEKLNKDFIPQRNLMFRDLYRGTIIGSGGFNPRSSYQCMKDVNETSKRGYDALAFGRWFIANPDLPERVRQWHEYEANQSSGPEPNLFNRYDRSTFYTHEERGYIDYPSLAFEASLRGDSQSSENLDFDGMQLDKYPLLHAEEMKPRMSNKAKL